MSIKTLRVSLRPPGLDHPGVEPFAFGPLPPLRQHRRLPLRRRHVRCARLKPGGRLHVPGALPERPNNFLIDSVDFPPDFL